MRAIIVAIPCFLAPGGRAPAQPPTASESTRAGTTTMFIPTSVLVDLAREIARREAYSPVDPRMSFVDLMEHKDRSPAWDGYVTAGFYWYGHLKLQIAINERTGQVVDPGACREYDYPDVRAMRREYARYLGARPLPSAVLNETFECDSLTLRPAGAKPSRPRSSTTRKRAVSKTGRGAPND